MKTTCIPFSMLAVVAGLPVALVSQPTDNPIQSYYGAGVYEWTEEIVWDNILDVTQAPYNAVPDDGLSDQAAFEGAIADASAAGGGIVYAPAGSYHFDDDLALRDGVVIRGETPAPATSTDMWTRTRVDGTSEVLPLATRGDLTPLDAPAQRSDYRPSTQLVFPEYIPDNTGSGTDNNTAFKVITVDDTLNARNYGLVYVDINHARIRNFEDVWSTGPFELTNLSADPDLRGGNIVVFGIRGNHMAQPDPRIPTGNQHPWQRFVARGAANISLVGYENILVANNRLNDEITADWDQPDYLLGDGTRPNWQGTNPDGIYNFNYTDLYGIVINRQEAYGNPSPTSLTPDDHPEAFRKGVVVRDNFLYNTMRVGYHITGQGAQIIDNIKIDLPNKGTALHPDGQRQHVGETLENRGIDAGGFNIEVTGNYMPIWSHIAYTSTDTLSGSVDGEAILQQAHTTSLTRSVTIDNNHVRGYIGVYKVGNIENLSVSGNRIMPGSFTRQVLYQNIFVMAHTNSDKNKYMKDVLIDGNFLNSVDVLFARSLGGWDNVTVSNHDNGSKLRSMTGVDRVNNQFGEEELVAPDFSYNSLPEVTLAGVTDGSTVASPVTLTATAADSDGVEKVEFWSDGRLLGEDTSAPYAITLTETDGTHFNVFAKAIEAGTSRENFSHESLSFSFGDAPSVDAPAVVTIARGPGSGEFVIGFAGEAGITYSLESSPDLSAWSDAGLPPITSAGGDESFTVNATRPAEFYRVVTTP